MYYKGIIREDNSIENINWVEETNLVGNNKINEDDESFPANIAASMTSRHG